MNLESLLGNKLLSNMLFKKVRELAKEHNLKAVLLEFDEKGEIKPTMFNESVRVLTEKEFETLLKG